MDQPLLRNIRELLPEPTLQRLPWYLAYLSRLDSEGIEFVSSTQIAKEINGDASQIAKDLSYLTIRGKTRIGYEVSELRRELEDILGFRRSHKAVMFGVGSLGAALIQDTGLSRYGLDIVAGFDVNPDVVGTQIGGIPVFHIDELSGQVARLKAEIGILAVPAEYTRAVADAAVASGIHAFWNFTPCRLRMAPGIIIQDTSIYSHLAVIYNRMECRK